MITETQDFTVELIENELINVELVENEILGVNLTQIDVINNTKQFEDSLKEYLIIGESPTPIIPLPSKRFKLANACISDKLQVIFNGLTEKYLTIHSDTEFSFGIDILDSDNILVNYIKKS